MPASIKILFTLNASSKKFRIYDIKTKTLKDKPDIKHKFYEIDSFYYNRKLFIFGGSNEGFKAIKNVLVFDLDKDEWLQLHSIKLDRYKKSVSMIDEKVYLFGGVPGDNMPEENSQNHPYKFEVIDYKKLLDNTGDWSILSISNYMGPTYLTFHSFITPDKLLILGGLNVEDDEEVYKGYILDFYKKELLQEFNLKRFMYSEKNTTHYRDIIVGSSYFEDYEDDEESDDQYELIGLDVGKFLNKNNIMPYH